MHKLTALGLACLLALCVAAPSLADWPDDLRAGVAAYKSGDHAYAFRKFQHLANQGFVEAQWQVARMYVMGTGVPKDVDKAVYWQRKAADQGYVLAQYTLGMAYASGMGVKRSLIHAYMWLSLAARNNHKNAIQWRDVIAKQMTPGQLSIAKRFADAWRPKRVRSFRDAVHKK